MADLDKTFQLRIIGDVTAYQQAMSQIPGITEKQAAAAALRMEREMVKAARATGTAAQQAASGGADALGKSFGQAKEQVALVAAGASKISPELGQAVNTASAALGVLKSMVSPVGALTAAVTLAAAAFAKLQGDIDLAEQKANDQAKAAIKAQLGLIDSGYYVNNALEAQDKASLLKRKGTWVAFARDYAEIFSLGGLNPIANAVLKKLDEYEAGIKDNIAALEGMRDSNIRLAQSEIDLEKARKKTTKTHKAQIEELQEVQEVQVETQLQGIEIVAESHSDAVERQINDANDAAQAEIEAAQQAARVKQEAQMAAYDTSAQLAQAGFEVAKSMFGDSKEIAMAEAVVNTASAVVRALANPPGPPFSTAQAIAAGAMGAAQIATIASTNIAHSGLSMGPAGGQASRSSDEYDFRLTKRERVLTGRGVDSLGGDGQVRRLNAGQSPSMGGKFVGITQFKHKMLDATIGPNIARPAAARTEIKAIAQSGGRVGHRLRSNT